MKPSTKITKTYSNERIKNASKKQHFTFLLKKYQNDAKNTWKTIKEAIGKTKLKNNTFPRRMII